jgi:hypothetical protein
MSKSVAALLALTLAGFALVAGVQSSAAGGKTNGIKQGAERWQIMQDQQPKAQKTLAPKGGSTGPTVPPKPTQGNIHR